MSCVVTVSQIETSQNGQPDPIANGLGWGGPRLQKTGTPLSRHPAWLHVLRSGLGHETFLLKAVDERGDCGYLPVACVRSLLFGRFLISLPYVNYGGPTAADATTKARLIDAAVELADRLDVRYLELRHEQAIDHARLTHTMTSKVVVRLDLPNDAEELWRRLNCKVRNQVRKGRKQGLEVVWGRGELLPDFYAVFARNMRDLGTPVYSPKLFRAILDQFPDRTELCVVRREGKPLAGALLLHGWGVTEVPSASSLREFNSTCANMLMYWHLLERAVHRGQQTFDFGRSTEGGPNHKFKLQWGGTTFQTNWQYYLRRGGIGDMRPEAPRYHRAIRLWQRLPVSVSRWIGPLIARSIP